MINKVTQEEIVLNWPAIRDDFKRFWDTTINYETLSNLKRRLLAEQCFLFGWSDERFGRVLFIAESCVSGNTKILSVTHTAGMNQSGKRFTRSDLKAAITQLFEEIEDLAITTYHDAVKIHARPAHVKLAKGYKRMATPIIKQL